MYIFKYHPDNTIYRNGTHIGTFAEFMAANPTFPLAEHEYFEYCEDGSIDSIVNGNHTKVAADQMAAYDPLISAINNLS